MVGGGFGAPETGKHVGRGRVTRTPPPSPPVAVSGPRRSLRARARHILIPPPPRARARGRGAKNGRLRAGARPPAAGVCRASAGRRLLCPSRPSPRQISRGGTVYRPPPTPPPPPPPPPPITPPSQLWAEPWPRAPPAGRAAAGG